MLARVAPALASAVFAGWMAVLGVGIAAASSGQTAFRLVAGLSAVAAVVAGVRRHQPSERLPWRLLVAAIVLSALGGAASAAQGAAGTASAAFAGQGSALRL